MFRLSVDICNSPKFLDLSKQFFLKSKALFVKKEFLTQTSLNMFI